MARHVRPPVQRAFSAFLTCPHRLGGTSAFCTRLHSRVHCGEPFNTLLASCLTHSGDLHICLHQLPRRVDLLFWGPCYSDFRPRLPIHFILVVCLLLLLGHSACNDDHLPPSVQRYGGANASTFEGGFGSTPLFFFLALGAALGPPRPQERASGAVGCFFRRTGVWHTADSPWTIPVSNRASAEGVSRQPPPPHGSLHSTAFGAWIIASLWICAFATCTLGGGVCVHPMRRCSSVPHALV